MRLTTLSIHNFRSIAHAEIKLSPFVCIVGHNNAGKSSLLMALSLFRSGSALKPTDFYDPKESITFEVTVDGIDNNSLARIGVHAERISEVVVDGRLTLIRRYGTDGKSKLNCRRLVPRETRFSDESIAELLKGQKGKSLLDAVKRAFPELAARIEAEKPTSQTACRQMIEDLAASLPPDQLESREVDLPTGIPTSVDQLLPEVVYIPAVKDASDEVKTKEASSFGKIIRVLLDLVEGAEELQNIATSFSSLHGLLNRTFDDKGEPTDTRLKDVRRIEERVQGFIREQFRDVNVEIEIPPPDLKTIFSGARIWLDDGVRGEVDSKGDGLKRAVTFSLLRTFVEMKREHHSRQDQKQEQEELHVPRYIFLFEEPELYLHPNAQRILYDALREIAVEHQVCVCTHSPYFFSASDTGTYIRLRKEPSTTATGAPCSQALHVNLVDDLSVKDSFQIICYENNNAAFFCDRVVLVEGDCDVIYLKHLARTMSEEWNFDRRNIAIVKVGGKGSFGRYRHFFESFAVDVRIVADLDAIIDEFDKLGASADSGALRATLLQEIDKLSIGTDTPGMTRQQLSEVAGKRTFRDRYERCKAIAEAIGGGASVSKEDAGEFSDLFAEEVTYVRRHILASDQNLRESKEKLLSALRTDGIVVLSKGAIEAYYPDGVEGGDKPSRALSACERLSSIDDVRLICNGAGETKATEKTELEMAFDCLFG